ncbi:hypothetical protein [Sphingobacterium faecium]|uniref:hypothetical protein n=1 Tax=Sphingobacterium faecium TaxID=34087 RepID=UPI002468CEE8|nr:hypothetical protein [Sphingobacterium faecium]MDH5825348.1 hypothetical protein [Sphingobacterium faecium]
MNKSKPKLILGMPRTFSIYKVMVDRLEQLGFEVIDISYDDDVFKYKNLWDRFVNLIRKSIFNDKGYKNRLKFKSLGNAVLKKLEQIEGKADYCLLIRADIYPMEVIEEICLKSNKAIAYQWDGVERYPAIKPLIGLFDRFYVFDRRDASSESSNYLSATNFYFGHLNHKEIIPLKKTFFFIGSFMKCRWEEIQRTAKCIIQNDGIPNFLLFTKDENITNHYTCDGIKFIDTPINYEETIKLTLENQVVVDFLTNVHTGLSFRVFEAIGYQRKLVTNNVDVKKYDFYHPNNIYILDNETRSLADFINEPYIVIEDEVLQKYNFDYWIKNMLEN